MRLTELDASFLKYASDGWEMIPTIEGADGVKFQCPKCAAGKEKCKDGKAVVGAHSVICWFENKVPDTATPGPGRWAAFGETLENLTLHPSISLEKSCGWHGYVVDGDAS